MNRIGYWSALRWATVNWGNQEAPLLFLQSARIAKAYDAAQPIHTFAPGSRRIRRRHPRGDAQSGSGPKGRPDCFLAQTSYSLLSVATSHNDYKLGTRIRRIAAWRFPQMGFHDRKPTLARKLENQFSDVFRRRIRVD